MSNTSSITLLEGDNLDHLKSLSAETYDLIVIDPPYGLGKSFQGVSGSFEDKKKGTEFIQWMRPRLREAKRVLKKNGSFFTFGDYREIHYLKVELDEIFGRKSFQNEIIWNYDYGGRSKSKWSAKHDTILWYSKDPKNYTFNYDAIDRIPYLAPGLVGPEKAAKGKTPTDVWWQTIVPTNGKERLGWPTQKPIALLNRIIKVHSNPGDQVLDFFAGSGTTGDAAKAHGRNVTLVEVNPDAISLIKKRLCLLPIPASPAPQVTTVATNNEKLEEEVETPSLVSDPNQK